MKQTTTKPHNCKLLLKWNLPLVVILVLLSTQRIHAQQLLDNFNRSNNASVGNSWVEAGTSTGSSISINTNQVLIGTNSSSGRDYLTKDCSALYNTTLSTNGCIMTWMANMRQSQTDPSGFDGGEYGIAFAIGANNATLTSGNGYAVVFGESGGTDNLRLVRYSGGLDANGNLTGVIDVAGTDFGSEYLAVKVTYDPSVTNQWSLYYASNASSFPDPSTAIYTLAGTASDNNTLLTSALNFVGYLYGHSSSGTPTAFFDNVYVPTAQNITLTTPPVALQTICFGAGVSFFAEATGTPSPSVKWQKLNGTWNDISGATSTTFNIPSTLLSDAGSYRAVFTNTSCVLNSNVATLVVSNPSVLASASQTNICLGTSTNLSAASTNNLTSTFSSTSSTAIPSTLIPQSDPAGITSAINVSGLPNSLAQVSSITVRINIDHSNDGDVEVYLIRPGGSISNSPSPNGNFFNTISAGQSICLVADEGSSDNDFVNTVFSDAGATSILAGSAPYTGTFQPLNAFSTLTGDPNGEWTLKVLNDATNTNNRTFENWTLTLVYTNGLSYSWSSDPAGFSSSLQNPGSVAPTVNTDYIITVTENVTSCTSSSSVSVTVVNPDDGNACTVDACNTSTGIVSNTPVHTDDGNPCTDDACDTSTGAISHTPNTSTIPDDGNACTTDICDAAGVAHNNPVDVDDNNVCTDDACDSSTGTISNTPNTSIIPDDGNACTTDVCDAAGNAHNNPVDIDDNNVCTDDACDTSTGTISNTPNTSIKPDDGNACTTDVCDAVGIAHNNPVDINDNNVCTDDACDTSTGAISHTPNTSTIPDDGNACTTDVCDAVGIAHNNPVDIDDNNVCTDDACDTSTGAISHTPNTSTIPDDGNACTTDVCDAAGVAHNNPVDIDDSNVCTDDACDTSTGTISHTPNTSTIPDDGNACTTDVCDAAGVAHNNPVDIDDSNVCTDDACDTSTGTISNTPNTSIIPDDGNACTTDVCDAAGVAHNNPVDIDDNNVCTDDACDSSTGVSHTPNTTVIPDDGNACTVDYCDSNGDAQNDPLATIDDANPCTVDACNTLTGDIAHTINTSIIPDDNNACTSDFCNILGVEQHYYADVEDNNVCTDDACDTTTGFISHTPNTSTIPDDNNLCTTDYCDSNGDEQHDPANIDDNNVCTDDACNTVSGITHTPNSSVIPDDNNACTTDFCDAIGIAQHNPVNIDDNNVCTEDACNSLTGAIIHTINTSIDPNDNNACTTDYCDTNGDAQHDPVNIDDNNVCTDDACDTFTGVISNTPNTAIIPDDNNPCTIDICDVTGIAKNEPVNIDDNNMCTDDACNTLTGAITHTPNASVIPNDNNACTSDFCDVNGVEQHYQANTDDNNACTDDACDTSTGLISHTPNTSNIPDDSNACTTDYCDTNGDARHEPVNTDDGNICTDDACDSSTGAISHTPNTVIIPDDGNACTSDYCDTNGDANHSPVNTEDNNVCTNDVCDTSTGTISHTPSTSIIPDDGNACTTDYCDTNGDAHNDPLNIDDNNVCTNDACDTATGAISHTPNISTVPDDGNACTTDYCDTNGDAQHDPVNIDDNNACTVDGCNTLTGAITHTINNSIIPDDNNACTSDFCNILGIEQHYYVDVEDNNACTDDACDSSTGLISHTPNSSVLPDDNNACTTDYCDTNGDEHHIPANIDDNNICTDDACNTLSGISHTPNTSIIPDDNNACTTDFCDANGIAQHNPVNIDDNNVCTDDACNTLTGAITHTTNTTIVPDDGNACTTDFCDSNGDAHNVPVNTDDNIVCTDDACDTSTGAITHTPNTSTIPDDGNGCTTDYCDSNGDAQHDPVNIDDNNVCTDDACNTLSGAITHTPNTATIPDDNSACTSDYCDTNGNANHDPANTDDNNLCTDDACDTSTGLISHTPNASNIPDDNNVCTSDYCDTNGNEHHDPVNVNDNNVCTEDACNTTTGVITHTPNTSVIPDDNDACTIDYCNTTGVAQHDPVNIDDGNACTTDACNTLTGVSNTPIPGIIDANLCTIDGCNPFTGEITHTLLNSNDGDPCTQDGCFSTTGIFHINRTPSAPISGGNQSVCEESPTQTLTATATAPAGAAVVWFNHPSLGSVVPPVLSGVGSVTFYAASKLDTSACYSLIRTPVTLTILARPTASITGGAIYCLCSDHTTTLTLTVTGSGTINGTLSDGTLFSGTAPTILVSVNPAGTTVYTVATLSDANCSALNIDLTGSATVTVNIPAVPPSETGGPVASANTVECVASATTPTTLPVVKDQCGNVLNPAGPVITDIPASLTCEGTREYAYTYTDCAGLVFVWKYTYTIDHTIAPAEVGGPVPISSTVQCLINAVLPTTLPVVLDGCGNVLSEVVIIDTEIPQPLTCEGNKIYGYLFEDCSGPALQYLWTYTYTIDRTTAPAEVGGPVSNSSTVLCASDAIPPTTLPVVNDVCGKEIPAPVPVVTNSPDPLTCEGTRTYTYTYTDCSNLSFVWTYTYTIEHTTSPVEVGGPVATTALVECISSATPPSVLPVVEDVCGNVVPAPAPVVTNSPDPLTCEGTRTYTYTYLDCAGLQFVWSYTYTIDHTTEPAEVGGPVSTSSTVECPADATPPTVLPVVHDVCGAVIPAQAPVITNSPDPVTCEGTRNYIYTYADCSGLHFVWTYTYTIDRTTAPVVPTDGSSIVQCESEATPPITPVVQDVCGTIVPAILSGTTTSNAHTQTFNYTGASQSFIVPPGVTSINIKALGAQGGTGSSNIAATAFTGLGGLGGSAEGNLAVVPGSSITIFVGGKGADGNVTIDAPSVGGFNGGGIGGFDNNAALVNNGGGGGGASDVRIGGVGLTNRVIVAAGGGGASGGKNALSPISGGDGGGAIGENGDNDDVLGVGGSGGNQGSGGGAFILRGATNGSFGVGGNGSTNLNAYGSGGAGGGYYGGGGGSSTQDHGDGNGGGGGGGSSYLGGVTSGTTAQGVHSGNGQVIITWETAGCGGSKTYSYTYTDCSGLSTQWNYTYTIDGTTAPSEFGGPVSNASTVECIDDTDLPSVLPVVHDACGNTLTPSSITGPVFTPVSPGACEGTVLYTFTYSDCEGLEFTWTYTYTVDRTTPPSEIGGPVANASTIECISNATTPTTLPVVEDVCGNVIPAPVPVVTDSPNPLTCEGTRTYSYTYTDCSNLSFIWTYTYTIEHTTSPAEVGGPVATTGTVECISSATAPTVLPVVKDVCGNIVPAPSPVVTSLPNPLTCEGSRIYTYTYLDCAGLQFVWSYTYTIDHTTEPAEVGGPVATSRTVECPADATPPTVLPVVHDVCGNVIPAPAPIVTNSPDPVTCEGSRSYIYTYADCSGLHFVWTYTYTIDHTIAPVIPVPNGTATVESVTFATAPIIKPTVVDVCGNSVTAELISVSDSPDPLVCSGTRIYTYRYIDCSGLISLWTYNYTIDKDDKNACTVDICDPFTGNVSHTPVDRNDNNPCTIDLCDQILGVLHFPVPMNDFNPCTDDECNSLTGNISHNPVNVDDGNACTIDACNSVSGQITHLPANVSDNNECTIDGCDTNGNIIHTAVNVDDGNACTADACNTSNGVVTHAAINTDDGNGCTTDVCNTSTGVITHNALPVGDGNACTIDACNSLNGDITHVAISTDDGNACTTDACITTSGTITHNILPVDDGNACTIDACNSLNGDITHVAVNTNDGNACTTDVCNTLTGAITNNALPVGDGNACTTDACNSLNGDITHVDVNTDDGNACTNDVCNTFTGAITHPARIIDDGNPCTNDACNTLTGQITHIPVTVDDNNPCTIDFCNTNGVVIHSNINVDDGNACTTDACNTVTGSITHNPVNTDDGNACTIDVCITSSGAITHLPVNTDDGNPCTIDGCNALTGVTNTPKPVDDGNACTIDFCDAATGNIIHTTVNSDDNNPCTTDACNTLTGAITHTAVPVDDGNACTNDGCNTLTGVFHNPVAIDDNNPCTVDACNTGTGTVSHLPLNVEDGNLCTVDACNTITGQITHLPVNIDDNNLCTTDGCNPSTGIISHNPVATDDNNVCTNDGCIPATGIFHNQVSSDDGNSCTTDGCDAVNGPYHIPVNIDDADACTNDACNTANGNITHTLINVDDGNACTIDGCDKTTGAFHTPVNTDDGNACTIDGCDVINGVSHIPLSIDDFNDCTFDACNTLTGDITHTDQSPVITATAGSISCYGGTTCITVSAVGGLPPYTGTGIICGYGAGSFSFDVTDSRGCNVVSSTITIIEPDKLTASTSSTSASCASNDGSAIANPSGGIPGYTYLWSPGGQTSNPVSGLTPGNYSVLVTDVNGCTTNASVIVGSSGSAPATPGPISGLVGVCKKQTGVVYCVTPDPNASSYLWTLPSGASAIGSSSGPCITLKFSSKYKGGFICVKAVNPCGSSLNTCLNVQLVTKAPKTPASINGNSSICPLTTTIYSIAPILNASSYSWSASGGLTIISGQGTTSIIVKAPAGFNSGNVSVRAINCKGRSGSKTRNIVKAPVCRTTNNSIAVNQSSYLSETITSLNAFPNPTSGKLTITFDSDRDAKYSLKIVNILGSVIIDESINGIEGYNMKQINLENVAKGLYFISIQTEGTEAKTLRIIVE